MGSGVGAAVGSGVGDGVSVGVGTAVGSSVGTGVGVSIATATSVGSGVGETAAIGSLVSLWIEDEARGNTLTAMSRTAASPISGERGVAREALADGRIRGFGRGHDGGDRRAPWRWALRAR